MKRLQKRLLRTPDGNPVVAVHDRHADLTGFLHRMEREKTPMPLIHTSRTAGRTGRPRFVPGGAACAASAKRVLLAPTLFPLSTTLKRVSGAMASPVRRLAPSPA